MPHVGDGDIHVYLDGALDLYPAEEAELIREHLRSCPDCVARLETERSLRSRAEEILAASGPVHVGAPPFEELRARAGKPQARAPARSRWFLSPALGWAASLLLAMAVGWAGRGVLVPADSTLGSSGRETSTEQPVSAMGEGDAAQERQGVSVAEAPVRSEEALDVVSPAAVERFDQPSVSGARRPAAPLEPALESKVSGFPTPSLAEPRNASAEEPEVGVERARDLADLAFRDASVMDEAEDAPPLDVDAPPFDLDARIVELERVSRGALQVPGLEVRSVGPAPAPNPEASVLIVQVLPGGQPVEFLHGTGAPPDVPTEAVAVPPDRRSLANEKRVVVHHALRTWDGGWTLASGPLSSDSLAALLRRLR